MKKYSVGFIFTKDLQKVLLIHKTHPEWQKGKINGVGGKLEDGETSLDCIRREVQEETNLETRTESWVFVGTIEGDGHQAIIDVFGYIYEGKTFKRKLVEKEEIEWFPVKKLPENVIFNLKWMIPLTLEKLKHQKIIDFTINYSEF